MVVVHFPFVTLRTLKHKTICLHFLSFHPPLKKCIILLFFQMIFLSIHYHHNNLQITYNNWFTSIYNRLILMLKNESCDVIVNANKLSHCILPPLQTAQTISFSLKDKVIYFRWVILIRKKINTRCHQGVTLWKRGKIVK